VLPHGDGLLGVEGGQLDRSLAAFLLGQQLGNLALEGLDAGGMDRAFAHGLDIDDICHFYKILSFLSEALYALRVAAVLAGVDWLKLVLALAVRTAKAR
jgi:hypothetical protein